MTNVSVNLYAYNYRQAKTYLIALFFILGNIVLPQIFHLVPKGGITWLPIYFFTLVGAYKYGWRVGLLTAIASPIVNSALFGMPMPSALPAILIKSVLLAIGAGWAASRYQKVSMTLLILIVAFYQIVGGIAECIITSSLMSALQDVRIGMPGIALQIIGGYAFIRYALNK